MPRWVLSANYLLFFAILGLVVPYLGLFLSGRGFNGEQIGLVLALFMATRVISPNLWAWLADRLGQRARIVRAGALLSLLCFLPLLLSQGALVTVVALVAFSFFWTAILPQLEAITLALLGDERAQYARMRAWGSVGFILTSPAAGTLLGWWGSEALVPMGLALLLGLLATTSGVRDLADNSSDERLASEAGGFRQPRLWLLLLSMLLLQISHGPYNGFYVLYLLEHGRSSGMAGALVGLGVVAEIVLFLYSARLLARYPLVKLLLLAYGLSVVRWLGIAATPDQLPLLALWQLLHAASFALAHAVAIQLVHAHFVPANRSRGQAFYLSFCYGLGGVFGSLYTGWLWHDGAGGQLSFLIAAAVAGGALLLGWRLLRA